MLDAGLSFGADFATVAKEVSSAFVVYGQALDLSASSGSLGVLVSNASSFDNSMTAGTAKFANGSLFIADGHIDSTNNSILYSSVEGGIIVENNAKLLITDVSLDAQGEATIKVADDGSAIDVADNAWGYDSADIDGLSQGQSIFFDSALYNATKISIMPMVLMKIFYKCFKNSF